MKVTRGPLPVSVQLRGRGRDPGEWEEIARFMTTSDARIFAVGVYTGDWVRIMRGTWTVGNPLSVDRLRAEKGLL